MARVPFKLKSGNSIPFKQMGSSPLFKLGEARDEPGSSPNRMTHEEEEEEEETTPKKRADGKTKKGVGPLGAYAAKRLSEMGEGKFEQTMGDVWEGSNLYKNIQAGKELSRMAKVEGGKKVAGDVLKGAAQFLPGAERRHGKKIQTILDAPPASGYGTKFKYEARGGESKIDTGSKPRIAKVKINGGSKPKLKAGSKGFWGGLFG